MPKTSESVSSDGRSSESSPTGALTRVPSANGTRMASACPPPIPFPAQNPPCRQDVCKPSRQKSHVPSDQAKGAMTKSPFFNVDTSRPVSSTTPTNSWPIGEPPGVAGMLW